MKTTTKLAGAIVFGLTLFFCACEKEDGSQQLSVDETQANRLKINNAVACVNPPTTLKKILPKGDFHLFSVSAQKYYQLPLVAGSTYFIQGKLNSTADASLAKYKITFTDDSTGYFNKYSTVNGNTVLEPLIRSAGFASYRTLDFSQSEDAKSKVVKIRFRITADGKVHMLYAGGDKSLKDYAVLVNEASQENAELKLNKLKDQTTYQWEFRSVE